MFHGRTPTHSICGIDPPPPPPPPPPLEVVEKKRKKKKKPRSCLHCDAHARLHGGPLSTHQHNSKGEDICCVSHGENISQRHGIHAVQGTDDVRGNGSQEVTEGKYGRLDPWRKGTGNPSNREQCQCKNLHGCSYSYFAEHRAVDVNRNMDKKVKIGNEKNGRKSLRKKRELKKLNAYVSEISINESQGGKVDTIDCIECSECESCALCLEGMKGSLVANISYLGNRTVDRHCFDKGCRVVDKLVSENTSSIRNRHMESWNCGDDNKSSAMDQPDVLKNFKNVRQRNNKQPKLPVNKSGIGSGGGCGDGGGSSGSSYNKDSTKSSASPWDLLQREPPSWHLYLILAGACLVVYMNGLEGDYVHDDVSAVLRNPDVQGTTPWWRVFLSDFWGRSMADPESHKSFRPLTILTFRWTHMIWGNSPLADHVFNLILHVGVTSLYAHTLLTALKLTHAHALICGLLFATHPVHTEAVTGVVGRADLLAATIFLSSFKSYHRSMQSSNCNGEWAWCCLAGALACVGVVCKENAITVLGVCILWDAAHVAMPVYRYIIGKGLSCDLTPFARRTRRMICLGIVVVFLRVMLMRGSPVFSEQDNPAAYNNNTLTRLQTFWFLPAYNIWILLCPSLLSYDWQMGSIPLVTSPYDIRNAGSLLVYLGLLSLAIYSFRLKGRDGLAIWWSLLLLSLPFVPASNLFFTVGFVVAERLLYIPSIGWCTLVGLGAVRLTRYMKARQTWRLLFLLFFVFSLKAIRRNLDWRSRETLFASGVRILPDNAKMHYNYANFLKDSERTDSAIHHYREAIRLWWSYPSAHNNLGTVLEQQSHYLLAEEHFSMALKTHPKHPHASLNLATLWRQQGRLREAISLLAPIFAPEEEEMGVNVGRLLAELHLQEGDTREAEDVYLSLAAAQPSSPSILAEYGVFLQKIGRTEAAARNFEAALSLDPGHTHALTNYAALSHARHQHAHAYHLYTRALEGTWDADTAIALARLCLLTDRLNQAEDLLIRVMQDHHHQLPAMVYLAQVRIQQKQYRVSEEILQEVLKEEPHHREAHYQLSLLYSASNRSEEAVEAAMEAARACTDPKDICALLHAHHADLLHTFTLVDAAITSYQLAVSLEPALIRAHLNLGAIYHIQGRYSLAWDHYSTAFSHDPTNALLLENMEKLRRVSKGSSSTSTKR